MNTGLLTDHYELTMLRAALRSGTAHRRAVFEMFARHLPNGRRYGVVAGTGRLLDALEQFRFGDAELEFLERAQIADAPTLEFLRTYQFSGDIWGYAEGDCYFPGSPILVVEGTFAEAVILETVALSIFNHDCAIASAASRMVTAAHGRPLVEMGSRRTHERAAVASARAAYIAGFTTTSNLRAGYRVRHPDQRHQRARLHAAARRRTAGVRRAGRRPRPRHDAARRHLRRARPRSAPPSSIAGPELGAIRIDSGDLATVAREARAQLDALGATKTRIVLTGDLDEFSIAALAAEPVDGYGVGTSLVTGSGAPTAALVYKLVARADSDEPGPLRPVAKRSVGKPSRGGRKWAVRRASTAGHRPRLRHETDPVRRARRPARRPLACSSRARPRWRGRRPRAGHRGAGQAPGGRVAELPAHARQLSRGYPAIPTVFEPDDEGMTGWFFRFDDPGAVAASASRGVRRLSAGGSVRRPVEWPRCPEHHSRLAGLSRRHGMGPLSGPASKAAM